MTHGQLFAGIGGFGLAAQWAGIENVWANEIDPYCCKVLKKNFKGLKIYEQDIREIGKHNLEPVDIISGGFPCQPFSHAGKRKGKEDDRYLWPEMLRVISEVNPAFVIGENVAGLKSMENGRTLEGILIDLEDIGYQVETFLVPACSVGAWHRRDRIWILCRREQIDSNLYSSRSARYQTTEEGFKHNGRGKPFCKPNSLCKDVPNTRQELWREGVAISQESKREESPHNNKRCGDERQQDVSNTIEPNSYTRGYWDFEPNVGRVANGIPSRVDRLKGLGNAIVPQVAYEIFKAIKDE